MTAEINILLLLLLAALAIAWFVTHSRLTQLRQAVTDQQSATTERYNHEISQANE